LFMSIPSIPIRFDDVDVENDAELDRFMEHLLDLGYCRVQAEVAECIRLGILDAKGNLLRHDLPEEMKENSGADFGG
jgi:hypothetical protein